MLMIRLWADSVRTYLFAANFATWLSLSIPEGDREAVCMGGMSRLVQRPWVTV